MVGSLPELSSHCMKPVLQCSATHAACAMAVMGHGSERGDLSRAARVQGLKVRTASTSSVEVGDSAISNHGLLLSNLSCVVVFLDPFSRLVCFISPSSMTFQHLRCYSTAT